MSLTYRQEKVLRAGALKNERSSWLDHWRDISDYLLPRSGRFFIQDRNRGQKRHNDIYDSTGTRALRTLAAGMMAGMTSPARPWFRIATGDNKLNEREAVKVWLKEVEKILRDMFARSNTYRALHSMYEELGGFGTGGDIVEENFEHVVWHHPLTVGEYCVATDDLGRVNTVYREFEMSVASMVDKFGIDNVSHTVRDLYTSKRGYDQWRPVLHVIEPRAMGQRDTRKRDAKNMRFASCYMEMDTNEDKLLRESGYRDFPGLFPRWHVTGGDIYGNSPGMEALGDIKQLQHEQLRKGQAIDFQTKPPLQIIGAVKGNADVEVPGGVTHIDASTQGAGVRSAFDVRLDLSHLREDIEDVRRRINQAFYADLFLAITNMPGVQPRNIHEIAERHEEKLLMLGPTLERLHNEMLDPLIDNAFARAVEGRLLPPPPPELEGMDLKIEFISTLAQAQRAVGLGAVDRLLGTVVAIAGIKRDAVDKIDTDQLIDNYADMLGVDPNIIVADEKVAILRDERAKREAAAQRMAAAEHAANSAQTLSQTDTSGKNGLTDVMQMFAGYGTT